MSPQLCFGTLLIFSSYLCDQLLLSSGTANVPNLKQSLRQCSIPYIKLFQNTPNIEHKKCLLLTFHYYNEHPTHQYVAITNSLAPSFPPLHMFMIYNHFYCWLCSQNLPLIMLWDHEFGENYPWPFSFTLINEHKKQYFDLFFPSKNWTHQFHKKHSPISSWLCNKTFRAVLLTIV